MFLPPITPMLMSFPGRAALPVMKSSVLNGLITTDLCIEGSLSIALRPKWTGISTYGETAEMQLLFYPVKPPIKIQCTKGIWLMLDISPAADSTWLARWSTSRKVAITCGVKNVGVTSLTGCSTGPPKM